MDASEEKRKEGGKKKSKDGGGDGGRAEVIRAPSRRLGSGGLPRNRGLSQMRPTEGAHVRCTHRHSLQAFFLLSARCRSSPDVRPAVPCARALWSLKAVK